MELNKELNLREDLFVKSETKAMRDGFGAGLVEAGRLRGDINVISDDLEHPTRAILFKESYPDRYFEVGVAEQNMIGVAAGMSLAGKIAVVASYAIFTPGQNWGQIRLAVAQNRANVKLAASHAGLSSGSDGPVYHMTEDLALMRALPNMTVLAPCDYWQTKKAIIEACLFEGPVYLRFNKEPSEVITTPATPFAIDKAQLFKSGNDVTVVACGSLVYEALLAAQELEKENISAAVINCHTIKPLDCELLEEMGSKTQAVVTVEEHQVIGGLGAAVAEFFAQTQPLPLEMVGLPGVFTESGSPAELRAKYGLTANRIANACRRVMQRKLKKAA